MDVVVGRRQFVTTACAAMMCLPDSRLGLSHETEPIVRQPTPEFADLKALVFDVFGTLVDWRNSVIAEGVAWGKATGFQIDWVEFTDRWRLGYRPAMAKVRSGELPWTRLDDLHRMILDDLLEEYHIRGLSEDDKVNWAHVWRRLKPWPDSVAGLSRLKTKYVVAPLSNGNIALMVGLAKFAGFSWDAILGAELVKHYKVDREVYLSVPYYLDIKPEQVMMVAAHRNDLDAARSCGLRTGFIYRPNEFGGGKAGVPDKAQSGDYDVVAVSATALAQQLGAGAG
jgi:2-haloacid dehalogenase